MDFTTTLPSQLNYISSVDHTWPCWGNPRTQDWHCQPKKGKIRPVIVTQHTPRLISNHHHCHDWFQNHKIIIRSFYSWWDLHCFRGMTKGQPQFLRSLRRFFPWEFLRFWIWIYAFVGTLVPHENSLSQICALGLLWLLYFIWFNDSLLCFENWLRHKNVPCRFYLIPCRRTVTRVSLDWWTRNSNVFAFIWGPASWETYRLVSTPPIRSHTKIL